MIEVKKENLKDVSRRKVILSIKNPHEIPYHNAQWLLKAKSSSSGTTDVNRREVSCSDKIPLEIKYHNEQELMNGKTPEPNRRIFDDQKEVSYHCLFQYQ